MSPRRPGSTKSKSLWAAVAFVVCLCQGPARSQTTPRVIEILASHQSRFVVQGETSPVITLKPGEDLTLRITAVKAKNQNRDGSIHGLTLLRASDHQPVPGWDFLLKPGTQEFNVAAPGDAGEYLAVCTVICSENHEGMTMKFIVAP